MADPFDTPGYRFALNRYPGDGTTTQWDIAFAGVSPGYISQDHVRASVVNDTTGVETPIILTPANFVLPTRLQITPAVPVGSTLVIRRDTPKDQPLLDYVDGALMIEKNLDTSNLQNVYAVAEMVDRFADSLADVEEFTMEVLNRLAEVESVADEAHDTADLALTTSSTALTTANAAVVTANAAVAGVAGATQAAIEATEAANAANAAAALATGAAEDAEQAALDALATSEQAVTTAQAAEATANGIDAKATQAQQDAAAALDIAEDAEDVANGIDAKATQALALASAAVVPNANGNITYRQEGLTLPQFRVVVVPSGSSAARYGTSGDLATLKYTANVATPVYAIFKVTPPNTSGTMLSLRFRAQRLGSQTYMDCVVNAYVLADPSAANCHAIHNGDWRPSVSLGRDTAGDLCVVFHMTEGNVGAGFFIVTLVDATVAHVGALDAFAWLSGWTAATAADLSSFTTPPVALADRGGVPRHGGTFTGSIGVGGSPTAGRMLRVYGDTQVDARLFLGSYTIATLPAASGSTGAQAFCSNSEGGASMCYSDGTDWISLKTGLPVAVKPYETGTVTPNQGVTGRWSAQRLPDGTMELNLRLNVPVPALAPNITVAVAATPFVYPVTFTSIDTAFATYTGGWPGTLRAAMDGTLGLTSTGTVSITAVAYAADATSGQVSVQVKGRWKA